jgi:hypothetical protein
LTFKAKVTSRGARNSRLVLMNASVYSAMNPHPTRAAAAGSPSPGSAAVSGIALSQAVWQLGDPSLAVLHSVETRDDQAQDCITP